jgi:hypothetical protein
MKHILIAILTAALAGCGVIFPLTLKPPPSRPIDYTVDVQPMVVFSGWDMDKWAQLAAELDPAFAQAGVAMRVLDPIIVQHASWERIDDEAELNEMMDGSFDGVRVWLVEDLSPASLGAAGALASNTELGGVSYPPTNPHHGVALSIGAAEDRNTLVHEMGHALGLSHPSAGADDCLVPEVASQYMSYCFATRNQFTADQIVTIRRWAATHAK